MEKLKNKKVKETNLIWIANFSIALSIHVSAKLAVVQQQLFLDHAFDILLYK